MDIKTKLSCGDTAYIVGGSYGSGPIRELTVGQVRVTVTDTPGSDGEIDGMPARQFDNYAQQRGYEEQVMCVETGIGSGSVYTIGVHAFATREEAEVGADAMRAAHAVELSRQEEWREKQRQNDLAYHRAALARLVSE